jgi:nucleoside-diphosphate-sugar epimerase
MGARIFLTGGSGFLGRYVVKALVERGDTVVNYDIEEPGAECRWLLGERLKEVSFEWGGIEDLSLMLHAMQKHRVEKIIHAAAIIDTRLLVERPILAYRINLGGTVNVLESARILGISKIVYLSSNGVCTAKRYEPMDEEHPVLLPNESPGNGPYSTAKISSEAFGMNYGEIFGLDFVSLRPSAIYGFGMRYPMYIKPMIENSLRGLPTRFETGRDFPRDYTYVKDVASAVIKALDAPQGSLRDRIFLIATGTKLVTPGEIAGIVRDLIPGADIQVGAGLTEWNKREIRYRGLINIGRAREQLGYNPQYDIRKGTEEYIQLYRSFLGTKRD